MSGKKKNKRTRPSHVMRRRQAASHVVVGVEIPRGDTKEDKKARRQIIRDFYAHWFANNPKKIWNRSLQDYIHIKGKSMNETSGQASASYESTKEVLRLSDILSNATLEKRMPPKRDTENQKPYSEILIMRWKSAMLVVGKQETTGEYVQYCISAKDKK